MTGLYDTDIRFDLSDGIIINATGDADTVSGLGCFIQDVKLEAITTEGDVFYDREYGWSLLDFIHSDIDEMLELELQQRVQMKLERRKEVDVESLDIQFIHDTNLNIDRIILKISFKTTNEEQIQMEVALDRLKVEVVNIG